MSPLSTTTSTPWLKTITHRILPLTSLPYYIHHSAFLPSLSLCLLYLTVLSLSGQMITYLISIGYTPLQVGVIRFVSTVFELSATWIAPWLMRRIGVVRAAMWSLSWQMIWLAVGAGWFFSGSYAAGKGELIAATGLVVGVIISRVGLWSYDLCAQGIIQEVSADIGFFFVVLTDNINRKSKAITGGPFRQSKPHSRTSLSWPRT